MTDQISTADYRNLLAAAVNDPFDADTAEPNLRALFTPDGHRRALQPDVTVVQGGRGVGKTVWFKVLQDQQLREVAAQAYQLPQLTRIEPTAGFGTAIDSDRYPGPSILKSLLAGAGSPVDIWRTVLAVSLGIPELRELRSWAERLAWVIGSPEPVERALEAADKAAGARGKVRLVLFDALERLHQDRRTADSLVGGILELALELRTRTRNFRAKVFIREDMLDSSERNFPDASKLTANQADLTWTETSLYGLLFHLMGNAQSPVAQRFRESHPTWRHEETPVAAGTSVRYRAPDSLVGDKRTQQAVFTEIAGQYMGTDHRKGHTYTWLPNHLMDGNGQVSPRSLLQTLSAALDFTRTRHAGWWYALHYEGIRSGVQQASRVRVGEIAEDVPWVEIATQALEGFQVPIEPEAILNRWTERDLDEALTRAAAQGLPELKVRTGPRDPRDYPGLIDELIRLGVMRRRANGRIDLPDIYRIRFGIGRRGGVPRIKGT
jgi:hypothetical protein